MVVVPGNSVYAVNDGCFGVYSFDNVRWFSCREEFHRDYAFPFGKTPFFYAAGLAGRANLARLVHACENSLGVAHSDIQNTNRPGVVRVVPSAFWLRQPLRTSFFTILLRAAKKVDMGKDRWSQAIFREPYFATTRDATNKFLSGLTFCPPSTRGWVRTFAGHRAGNPELRRPSLCALLSPVGAFRSLGISCASFLKQVLR